MDPRVLLLEREIDRVHLDHPPDFPDERPYVSNPAPADKIVDGLWDQYKHKSVSNESLRKEVGLWLACPALPPTELPSP